MCEIIKTKNPGSLQYNEHLVSKQNAGHVIKEETLFEQGKHFIMRWYIIMGLKFRQENLNWNLTDKPA